MSETLRLLLVEDNPADVDMIRELLSEPGPIRFEMESASRLGHAIERVQSGGIDVVLLDLGLPDSQGLDTFDRMRNAAPDLPIVVLTGNADHETARAAVKAGAQDYLIKGQVREDLLVRAMLYAMERKQADKALRESEQRLKEAQRLGRIGHWDYDLETRRIRWSDMVFALFERDPKLGPPTEEEEAAYYSAADAERLRECARTTVEKGEPYEIDVTAVLPSGRCMNVAALGAPVRDSRGRIVGLHGTVQDITERKQAEKAINASETRYRRLFESAKDGILILDAETGMVVDVNPFLIETLGMSHEAFLGKKVWELGFLKDIMASEEKFKELQQKGFVRYDDLPLKTADGREIDVEFVSNVYLVNHQKVIQCNIRNITYRKRAADALRKSEEKYRLLVDTANEAILVAQDGLLKFVNRKALSLLAGYSEQEILNRPFPDFIHPDDRDKVTSNYLRRLKGEAVPSRYAFRVMGRDGIVTWVEISATVIDWEGKPATLNFLSDISERKQAEDSLRESVEKYRSLFMSSRDAIMTLAPPSWQFTAGNPSAIAMFGALDEVDFASRAPWEYSPETQPDGRPSQDKAKEMIELAMRQGSHLFEWTHRRLHGEDFPATVLLIRMKIGGAHLLQATVRDITERKRAAEERANLEEQVRVAQKMEAVGLLAGGVAHDFNNLLSVIRSYVDFAIEDLREGDPIRDDMLEVRKAAKRATVLTRQLLAFGRRQLLQPVPLDLNQVVGGVESMLRRIIGEDIDLVPILAKDLGRVMADPGQIEQVITNIAVNARDAMPHGGKLIIETANADLDEEYAAGHVSVRPGPYVMLAITDTGCGMDKETQARIFEPFFTTKEKGKGTGLGLSMVYGIVKQSGGNIWVYSEIGLGTTFKVYLPRTDTPPAETVSSSPPEKITGGETVLIVEDDDSVRRIAKRVLTSAGYRVLSAANGGEALLLCEEQGTEVDLLLTDVVMPQMNGKELADRLALQRPGLKVLFMSGYSDNAIAHQGVLDPGTRFLEKPFSAVMLTRKVREILDEGPIDGAVS